MVKRSGAKNHTVLLSRAIMQDDRQCARAHIVLRIHAHGQHGVTTGAGNAYQQSQTVSYSGMYIRGGRRNTTYGDRQ